MLTVAIDWNSVSFIIIWCSLYNPLLNPCRATKGPQWPVSPPQWFLLSPRPRRLPHLLRLCGWSGRGVHLLLRTVVWWVQRSLQLARDHRQEGVQGWGLRWVNSAWDWQTSARIFQLLRLLMGSNVLLTLPLMSLDSSTLIRSTPIPTTAPSSSFVWTESPPESRDASLALSTMSSQNSAMLLKMYLSGKLYP